MTPLLHVMGENKLGMYTSTGGSIKNLLRERILDAPRSSITVAGPVKPLFCLAKDPSFPPYLFKIARKEISLCENGHATDPHFKRIATEFPFPTGPQYSSKDPPQLPPPIASTADSSFRVVIPSGADGRTGSALPVRIDAKGTPFEKSKDG